MTLVTLLSFLSLFIVLTELLSVIDSGDGSAIVAIWQMRLVSLAHGATQQSLTARLKAGMNALMAQAAKTDLVRTRLSGVALRVITDRQLHAQIVGVVEILEQIVDRLPNLRARAPGGSVDHLPAAPDYSAPRPLPLPLPLRTPSSSSTYTTTSTVREGIVSGHGHMGGIGSGYVGGHEAALDHDRYGVADRDRQREYRERDRQRHKDLYGRDIDTHPVSSNSGHTTIIIDRPSPIISTNPNTNNNNNSTTTNRNSGSLSDRELRHRERERELMSSGNRSSIAAAPGTAPSTSSSSSSSSRYYSSTPSSDRHHDS
jgi:hypothetical protein